MPDVTWKPVNTKAIASNVKKVLSTGNTEHLTGSAYAFIIGYMGFIAHYNRFGFIDAYPDTKELARTLLTSELSHDPRRNRDWAAKRAGDPFFANHTSPAYARSVVDTLNAVCDVAEAYLS